MAAIAPFFWVAVFGLLVGATELIQRYREEPLSALRTPSAITYLLVNALASILAYYLIDKLFAAAIPDPVARVITAGVGGMAFLRSAVLKARVGEQDIAVGPAAMIDALLFAADRDADRRMALDRIEFATPLMQSISFELAYVPMKSLALGSMQNLSAPEVELITQRLDRLADSGDIPEDDKAVLLALALSVFVGRSVVEAIVRANATRWDRGAAEWLASLDKTSTDQTKVDEAKTGQSTPDKPVAGQTSSDPANADGNEPSDPQNT